MRDHADNVVIVCSIENIDPMGVHTGDSVTVAPQQTLTDRLYQKLRDQAIAVIRAVGVETGGSNVQFAVNPATDEIVVIEMNPRVSRSSALASKATGFPIAKIAARLAVGYTLDEIPNDITRAHARELRADARLRRRQVAAVRVREVPRRRRDALDAHEVGRRGDGDRAHVRAGVRARRCARASSTLSRDSTAPTRSCSTRLERPSADRFDLAARAPAARRRATASSAPAPASTRGSCASCARLDRAPFAGVRTYKAVDTCAAEFEAETPYYYSAWERDGGRRGPPRRQAERDDPRLRPEPDRPGDRVRLLLRARGDDRARVRPRRGDGQLQPGDRLDRLRHVRPAVLRAADARGRAGDRRGRAARGRDRVRSAARRRCGSPPGWRPRACRCSARSPRRSTSPRTAGASARCSTGSG